MEPVRDLNQFSSLIREARSSGQPILTNCYLLPAEINASLAKNALFWKAAAGGVLFLREEAAFYQLYYFINPNNLTGFQALNKPVVLEWVYRDSGKPSSVANPVSCWETCGFAIYHTYLRMELAGTANPPPSPASNRYRTAGARPGDMDAICRLWAGIVDRFTTATPAADELADLIARQLIHCVMDEQDNVVAVLQAQQAGKVYTLNHLAVDPAHRRQGLGHRLMQFGIDQARGLGARKILLWVADDNVAARQLHQSLGFEYDGKVTVQLLFASTN